MSERAGVSSQQAPSAKPLTDIELLGGGGWALLVAAAALGTAGVQRLMGVARSDWDPLQAVFGGLLWLGALRLSRRGYLRRGVTVPSPRARGWLGLVAIYVAIVGLLLFPSHLRDEHSAVYLATIAGVPGLFHLAVSTSRESGYSLLTFYMLSAPALLRGTRSDSESEADRFFGVTFAVFAIGAAVVLAFVGLKAHRAFSRQAVLRDPAQ